MKALSPGINDPGTAVESMEAIITLLQLRVRQHPKTNFEEEGSLRVVLTEKTVEEMMQETLGPIWHYGKNDPIVQRAFRDLLAQLHAWDSSHPFVTFLLDEAAHRLQRHQVSNGSTGSCSAVAPHAHE